MPPPSNTRLVGLDLVTEFQRRDILGIDRVIGEVAIDATSHPLEPSPIFANLPGRVLAWLPGAADPRAKAVPVVDLYRTRFRCTDVPRARRGFGGSRGSRPESLTRSRGPARWIWAFGSRRVEDRSD
jgi:hypothetical protein